MIVFIVVHVLINFMLAFCNIKVLIYIKSEFLSVNNRLAPQNSDFLIRRNRFFQSFKSVWGSFFIFEKNFLWLFNNNIFLHYQHTYGVKKNVTLTLTLTLTLERGSQSQSRASQKSGLSKKVRVKQRVKRPYESQHESQISAVSQA